MSEKFERESYNLPQTQIGFGDIQKVVTPGETVGIIGDRCGDCLNIGENDICWQIKRIVQKREEANKQCGNKFEKK